MINVFYGFSGIWTLIMILYLLNFSNLCTEINLGLNIFIIFGIILSFLIGTLMKKRLKFYKLTKNPHKKSTVTKLFVLYYIVEILYARKIPLLGVLSVTAYNSINYNGLPYIHMIIGASSIFYSFYLSYIYVCFKDKKVLLENLLIISYFVLLVQRQNILICMIMFANNLYAASRTQIIEKIKKSKNKIVLLTILVLIIFYGFGVFGNMRYGNSWKWNDSSMIEKLGQMNDNYPSIVPKEYFWSYLYLVSPLVNLNYNINQANTNDNLYRYIMEYIPDFLRNKIFSYEKEEILLPVSSLTASSAYIRTYKYGGYLGMYLMLIIQLLVSAIIVNCAYKNKKQYFVVISNAVTYFLLFTFFTNTFVYSTTGLILIIAFIYSSKIKKIVIKG